MTVSLRGGGRRRDDTVPVLYQSPVTISQQIEPRPTPCCTTVTRPALWHSSPKVPLNVSMNAFSVVCLAERSRSSYRYDEPTRRRETGELRHYQQTDTRKRHVHERDGSTAGECYGGGFPYHPMPFLGAQPPLSPVAPCNATYQSHRCPSEHKEIGGETSSLVGVHAVENAIVYLIRSAPRSP